MIEAVRQGADWAEVDVTISADGHAIIFHDHNLVRCTDGKGLVIQKTLAELKALDAVSTLTDVRSYVETLRDEQLEKALKQIQNGGDPEKVLRTFAHTFGNKMLHKPMTALRRAGAEGRREVLDWSRELFDLDNSNE